MEDEGKKGVEIEEKIKKEKGLIGNRIEIGIEIVELEVLIIEWGEKRKKLKRNEDDVKGKNGINIDEIMIENEFIIDEKDGKEKRVEIRNIERNVRKELGDRMNERIVGIVEMRKEEGDIEGVERGIN